MIGPVSARPLLPGPVILQGLNNKLRTHGFYRRGPDRFNTFLKDTVNYFLISLMALRTDSAVIGIFVTLAPVA